MISRRDLISRAALLGAGGLALYLVRDRIPWPPVKIEFPAGRQTPWSELPRRGGLIEIEGTANGEPVRVVVDSGAQFSAIDRGLSQRLALPQTVALPMLAYGVSGQPDLTYTVKFDLDLPGLSVRALRAATLNLARLGRATGRPFDILLGRDVLRELVLEADFPRRRVRFLAEGAYQPPPDARLVPLKMTGGAPMTPVRVEGSAPIDVMVDTGATGVLALSAQAAGAAGLLEPGRRTGEAASVSLGGVHLDRIVHARSIEVAGVTLRDVGVQVYSPSARGPIPSGLLGTGFLRRFRMALELGQGRLHLVPASPEVVRRNHS